MGGMTQSYRPAGPTVALSVVATSHAAVALNTVTNDIVVFCSLLNTGAVAVAVRLSQLGTAATLPVDGTPGDYILPALMQLPVNIPMPQYPTGPCFITAIGAAAGPSLVYATPVVMQE